MTNERTSAEDYEEEEFENIEEEEGEEEATFPRRRPERGTARAGGRPRAGGGRFRPRRKVCSFCVDKVKIINYKEPDTLRRFVDHHGKIIPQRKTGTCAKHQRRLSVAIKRARHLALLPFAAGRSPYDQR